MRVLMYMTIATVIVPGVGCWSRPTSVSGLSSDQGSRGIATDKHIVVVQHGYLQDGRVGYIVFTVGTKSVKDGVRGMVTVSSDSSSNNQAYLEKPDGERIILPTQIQLFECIDGQYAESKEKVSREVFEAFLASKPEEYTIRALLAFGEKEKKR